jgi:hypothetical protein
VLNVRPVWALREGDIAHEAIAPPLFVTFRVVIAVPITAEIEPTE